MGPVAVLGLFLILALPGCAQTLDDRLRVQVVTDEAEAALSILEARDAGMPPAAAWQELFRSEGYRRLKEREAAMRVPFTDEEFRFFLLQDRLLDAPALRRTLQAWSAADPDAAAKRAFAYLPEGAVIAARVYPMVKPKHNSFVYDLENDPAIFLYLDPATTAAEFENTMAHELHHIGFSSSCGEGPSDDLPEGVRRARDWMSAFGEGLAMLAAAGGPAIHPHTSSSPKTRAVWNQNLKNVRRDIWDGSSRSSRISPRSDGPTRRKSDVAGSSSSSPFPHRAARQTGWPDGRRPRYEVVRYEPRLPVPANRACDGIGRRSYPRPLFPRPSRPPPSLNLAARY